MNSESLSPSDKLILVLTVLCGLFVHFYDLNLLSGWTDEFASIYFADHLSSVYGNETHPPLFYLYLKPFVWAFNKDLSALRTVVSATSVGLIFWACFLCNKLYGIRGALLLGILLCFSPVEIVHSRMIRQYSVFFELTAILILHAQIPGAKLLLKGIIAFVLMGIHPIGFLPVLGLVIYNFYANKKVTNDIIVYVSLITWVFLYYISKIILLSEKQYLTGYLPQRDFNFYWDVLKTLAGEHFPKINFHPIPIWFVVFNFALVVTVMAVAIKKKVYEPLLVFASICGVSILSAEVISLVMVNIKLGRYYSFLMAPILLLTVVIFYRNKFAIPIAFGMGLVTVTVINPFSFYPGEREVLGKNFDLSNSVLCANKYQFYYYFDMKEVPCIGRFKYFLEKKQNFVYVDLNGYGRENLIYYSEFFEIRDYYYYGILFRAFAKYKDTKKP